MGANSQKPISVLENCMINTIMNTKYRNTAVLQTLGELGRFLITDTARCFSGRVFSTGPEPVRVSAGLEVAQKPCAEIPEQSHSCASPSLDPVFCSSDCKKSISQLRYLKHSLQETRCVEPFALYFLPLSL